MHSISDQPSRESYERRKPNAAAHRVVHLAAASSLSHPVYCSLSRSQMLQPPHFNVAARDLAHERTCETAANPPADASPAWSCGQPRDRVAAVRARDATQRLRPAARCGLRITALISIHSHWWLLPPHARKNPIQITCRYMAALLESCTENGAQDRGNYHGKCCSVIRSAKITAQDSALHSTSSPLAQTGSSLRWWSELQGAVLHLETNGLGIHHAVRDRMVDPKPDCLKVFWLAPQQGHFWC